MSAKAKLAQQARRERERLATRTIPVYEGGKLVKKLDMGQNDYVGFTKSIYKAKSRRPKPAKKINSGKGCLFLTLLYFIGLPTYLWATQSTTEITGIVEAKEEPIIVTRVLAVEEEIKVEPEVKIEVTEPVFDSSREDLESYICSKDWDCEIAKAILTSENRNWNCQAINTHNYDGSVDKGLWQINSVHNKTDEELFNCYTNTDIAYSIYQSQGWNAWTAYWRGSYKEFLVN